MNNKLTTHQVAEMAKVHRDTLLRWLREGRIPEPARDRNGWRVFTASEAQNVVEYASGEQDLPSSSVKETASPYLALPVSKLGRLDWDFTDANTGYLTHSLHPYPAKFIPQIPNALIQELSSMGDTVLDPFCGSGTTLVEAILLKRHAVGVDANPLACLIARAKTAQLRRQEIDQLRQVVAQVASMARIQDSATLPLFPDLTGIPSPEGKRPSFQALDFWFDDHVIDELAALKGICFSIESLPAREVALTAFSSIIVAVSRQDSDTRYVRREKGIQPGDVFQRFIRALSFTIDRSAEFAEIADPRFSCRVIHANVLDEPDIGQVDLVVCSPPYPNAYSYHLYHRSRMLWLDMDQTGFKRVEIGSHRKYSRKTGAADAQTFRQELHRILAWVRRHLRTGGYVCFVLGDSVLKGRVVQNDRLFMEAAVETGYAVEANLTRQLNEGKKSFNPAIGKIKAEHIVILRNVGGYRIED